MGETGVIALDPARLGGLETYLEGLGDGCRRRAARVADDVAGTGLSADRPVTELQRIAAACHRERDDVAWRRAIIEALPDDLPLTRRVYATRSEAEAAAEALAHRVIAALEGDGPPRWSRLARLLAELDRSAGAPSFAAAFFATLGGRRSRRLPLLLERAWRDAALDPLDQPQPLVLATQERLADALRTASRVTGPGALGETWCRIYAGLPVPDVDVAAAEEAATPAERDGARQVEQSLRRAGYGAALAARVAQAIGWRWPAAALTVDRGVLGLVAAPFALADDDGVACDVPEAGFNAAAAGITIVGAVVPGAAVPAIIAGAVVSGLATLFGGCRRQQPRTNETHPTVDPSTGQSRLPSGHATNPRVDGAGVPLSPAYS